MVQLIDDEDVKKKEGTQNIKNCGENTTIGTILLICADEVRR